MTNRGGEATSQKHGHVRIVATGMHFAGRSAFVVHIHLLLWHTDAQAYIMDQPCSTVKQG